MRARYLQKFTPVLVAVAMASVLSVIPAVAQRNVTNSNGGSALHGVPPSVTSFGFGGQPGFHGMPASVTSPGFGSSPFHVSHGPVFFQHRRHSGLTSPFFGGAVAVPYAYPVYVMDSGVDDSMEENYRSGPTIFDRRGPGTEDYRRPQPPAQNEERAEPEDYRTSPASNPPQQQEVVEQAPTVLVFKDGRQLEVRNYAIVGATLYDLSDGRTHKVALAELDLSATVKQNDDRGVDFQVPVPARSN